ncbi:MAG TPA: (d)CMP kinase [Candidatus Intestinimonas stercorigallinarum]|nr:(d)CMP kinase [Candidatus Intestinimonas stercorigallinarum]
MGHKSVAIDGPSGAGKSTLARQAAQALGFLYVDTGAIYRTLGLLALERGVDPSDGAAVTGLLPQADIRLAYDGGDGLQRMYLCGRDVTEDIRRPEVSRAASGVSAIPAVREFLLETQRELARQHDVIMDGRDIGTVVLPAADVKIFLTASPEARARRRCDELAQRGTPQDLETVLAEIVERDRRDTTRETAPLRRAEDAVLVDTTKLDLAESLQALLDAIRGELEA